MRTIIGILFILIFLSPLRAQDTTQHYTLKFTNSNIKILSDAYLHYGSNFNDILFAFQYDSTLFNERYNDTCYIQTTLRKEFYRTANDTGYYESNFGHPSASIRKINVKEKKFWALDLTNLHDGYFKNYKDMYGFDLDTRDEFSLLVFPSMQSKKLLKNWVKEHEMGDHRIYYNSKTNKFELEIKTKNDFKRFTFFPYYKEMEKMTEPEIADLYYLKFKNYAKKLYKRENKFNKNLVKKIAKIQRDREKLLRNKWEVFKGLYMSEEEKKMTPDQWLDYYNLVVQDEFKAVMNSEPKKGLIDRYLREIGDRMSKMDLADPNRMVHVKANDKLILIDHMVMVNTTQMYFCTVQNGSQNHFRLNLNTGDEYAFLIKTVHGEYGIVSKTIDTEEVQVLEFKLIPEDLVSIGMFSKKAGL